MRESVVERAKSLVVECETAARAQGCLRPGDDDCCDGSPCTCAVDYNLYPADLDYVTDTLGTKLTREEWKGVGLGWVGARHVAEE
jgi:hypothetical protein